MKKSNIIEKSFEFALKLIQLYKVMQSDNEYVISKQLLRSGTSIGANVKEALAGYSKNDFLAKMSIASKEVRETNYWLRLLKYGDLINNSLVDELLNYSAELIKILTSIVKTSQLNTVKTTKH